MSHPIVHTNRKIAITILALSPILICIVLLVSMLFGTKTIAHTTVLEAFFDFDPDNADHQIITYSRFSRAIGSFLIGAFLAISGSLMQGMTRNYLASPSIMGVTAGSGFAITICIIFFPNSGSFSLIIYSLIGSLLGVLIVFGLASVIANGFHPVRLAIIGTIIGTFLSSFSSALAIYYKVTQQVSFWYNARLHQLDPTLIKMSIPFGIVGVCIAIYISKSITIISLGEEMAVGLGEKTFMTKMFAIIAVAILTGISVALAGEIAFIGLIIPHMTRFLIGSDYRFVIPVSGVLGGLFLTLADVGSRFLNHPFETPISVITSLIGVPFFLFLIKKRGGKGYA